MTQVQQHPKQDLKEQQKEFLLTRVYETSKALPDPQITSDDSLLIGFIDIELANAASELIGNPSVTKGRTAHFALRSGQDPIISGLAQKHGLVVIGD